MMGALGHWIDGLTDEERDRIVEAQEWGAFRVPGTWIHDDGCGLCLVQVVHGDGAARYPDIRIEWYRMLRRGYSYTQSVSNVYEDLCVRFGIPRVVRACKLRAGWVPDLEPAGVEQPEHATVR